MEKVIWVIGSERKEMLEAQRRINSTGSMRAVCLLSIAALERAVQSQMDRSSSRINSPSLVIVDYETVAGNDFQELSILKNQQSLAGVPLFFMIEERSRELDEECFSRGGMVVLHKPFSKSGILRIERMAWQHEVTKNYEKMLQKQAGDLQAAREIMRLNQKLESRNELLYQVFGRYFSDKVLDAILEHPESAVIGGEKRELTVMMSDLRGFTSLSEEIEPEGVTRLLNFYFGKMMEIINRYRGTIIEFLGDGVLAVFGAPLSSENHTADAVAAAIQMQNGMADVNAYCKQQGYPMLEMGIGIHSGEAFIGNVGSEKMMRYNVIGKVVNECSRIESCSVGGQVLVSQQVLENISCTMEVHHQMEINVKGIHKPVVLCEVTGIGGDYNCHIENNELEVLKPIEEQIVFNLYRVEGKIVTDKPVKTVLQYFAKKQAVVLSEEKKEMDNLKLYSDVEILAVGMNGEDVFDGVYAKVVEKNKNSLVLHFTYVNENFHQFVERMQELSKK